MTEQLEINRQTIYLTVNNVRVKTDNGIEERENQFVAYIKNDEPNGMVFGEQVKNSSGENIVFNSQDDAREYVIDKLKRTVYPPDFKHPLQYTKENLSELMHKKLIYDVGNPNSEDVTDTIEGVMTECSLAGNSPYLPTTATISTTQGEQKKLTFFDIKRIRRQ